MNFGKLLFVSFVISVQNLFIFILMNLRRRIWVVLYHQSCSLPQYGSNQYLFTFFRLSILRVMDFWTLLYCNLRTENTVPLWTVLEVVDSKIWLFFKYKSCTLFNLDVCRIFVCSHYYCRIKVIKMGNNSTVAVCLAWTVFAGRRVGV
jgi:hypothetical protein